jgi:hypothetical protein
MPQSFVAAEADRPSGMPPQPANSLRGGDMDINWEQERLNHDKAIEHVLSDRDPRRIEEGIEAYKRDLPQLLRDDKERHVVAYDGSTRVGIAETREQLLTELERKGLADEKSLFIKIVSSLEDNREDSCSSSHL